MLRVLTLCAIVVTLAAPAWARQGLTYRFRGDNLSGQVWVQGENARREIEPANDGRAAGRVELWKDGGKQVLVLDSTRRTYYDDVAMRARTGMTSASLLALTVRTPFRVEGVEDVRVDLKDTQRTEQVSGLFLPPRAGELFVHAQTLDRRRGRRVSGPRGGHRRRLRDGSA